MADVAADQLATNTDAVLERVAAGEELTVTVDGRPVATLAPPSRPRFVSTVEFFEQLVPADRAMLDDIRAVRGEQTTDDLAW